MERRKSFQLNNLSFGKLYFLKIERKVVNCSSNLCFVTQYTKETERAFVVIRGTEFMNGIIEYILLKFKLHKIYFESF